MPASVRGFGSVSAVLFALAVAVSCTPERRECPGVAVLLSRRLPGAHDRRQRPRIRRR